MRHDLDPATVSEATPLWQFIPINDYNAPEPPLAQKARRRLAFLRNLFSPPKEEADNPFKASKELQHLPPWQMERIAPDPDWQLGTNSLNDYLQTWLEQNNAEQQVILLVGPPYSGYDIILRHWAEQQQWQCLAPPPTETILSRDLDWTPENFQADQPWVLPHLEHCYLRHADGLDLIRRFLDRAFSGELGRGIIACDSWAWEFLKHIWQGRSPVTLTLQAFDQDKLAQHFRNIALLHNPKDFVFRQTDAGQYIIKPDDTIEANPEISDFLESLAGYSRGNVGVARAVWRANLRTEPDQALFSEAEAAKQQRDYRTIWMTTWNQISHSILPDSYGIQEAFVLHALLLHNGLSSALLRLLLQAFSPSQVMETVLRLEKAELIQQTERIWRVTAYSYPEVRIFLQDRGFLVDAF